MDTGLSTERLSHAGVEDERWQSARPARHGGRQRYRVAAHSGAAGGHGQRSRATQGKVNPCSVSAGGVVAARWRVARHGHLDVDLIQARVTASAGPHNRHLLAAEKNRELGSGDLVRRCRIGGVAVRRTGAQAGSPESDDLAGRSRTGGRDEAVIRVRRHHRTGAGAGHGG